MTNNVRRSSKNDAEPDARPDSPSTPPPGIRSKKQVIGDIERIAQQPGFIHILVLLCRRDLFLAPGATAEKDWRESLSSQELGFLTGLMVKHPLQSGYPDEERLDDQIAAIDELFRELHDAYNAPMVESLRRAGGSDRQNPPWGAGDYFAEGIFYDGSGAYDFQYLDLAAKRYAEDDPWIVKHLAFSITTACAIARQLKSLIERRVRNLKWPHSFEDDCDQLLNVFCFESRDITSGPQAEVAAFLASFSLQPGEVNQDFGVYGDYNFFDARPILRMGNDRYFLPISFTLTQSIYDCVFRGKSSTHSNRKHPLIPIEVIQ